MILGAEGAVNEWFIVGEALPREWRVFALKVDGSFDVITILLSPGVRKIEFLRTENQFRLVLQTAVAFCILDPGVEKLCVEKDERDADLLGEERHIREQKINDEQLRLYSPHNPLDIPLQIQRALGAICLLHNGREIIDMVADCEPLHESLRTKILKNGKVVEALTANVILEIPQTQIIDAFSPLSESSRHF